MQTNRTLFYVAWKKLILAYVMALTIGFLAGTLLVKWGHIQPERLFEASSKRISLALPVFDKGIRRGIDMGLLLFAWNTFGALATLSFIHTAAWFDPDRLESFPRGLRKLFFGRARMKLLCYLPGCAKFEAEALRRLYVWVMVPLLGLLLLGVESGLQVSTITFISGSFITAIIAFLPHGLIEIPSFALAGAVAYSAHLLMDTRNHAPSVQSVFQQIETHRRILPLKRIALATIVGLLVAGWVEAHLTPRLMQMM